MTSEKTRDKERTIAYRLGRPYTDRLEDRAEEAGLSVGQYARLVLVMHFEETALHQLADEVTKLRDEVTELRVERALEKRAA